MSWLLIVFLNIVDVPPVRIEFQTKELCEIALQKIEHVMEAGKGIGATARGQCIQVKNG